MNKIISSIIIIGVGLVSYAQEYTIQWGEVQKSNGILRDILPVSGSDFYSLRWSGGYFGTTVLARHDHFVNTERKKIEMKVESGMASFEGVKRVGAKLFVFLSDRTKDRNHFFMQEYGKDLTPVGPSEEIASYQLEKGKNKGSFDIITSRNNSFLGVVWSIPGKNDTKDRYGFKIMDSSLNEVSYGEYELPYNPEFCSIDNYYLSNTGDYFISVTEFKEGKRTMFRNYLDYKAVHILHLTPDNVENMTLDMEGKRIEAMEMNSDNKKIFTIAGVYGEKGEAGVSGLFYLRIDFDKKEVINEGFEKFGKDFITQDWTDRQKQRAEKREIKGKGEPTLYNYVMRQTEVLTDGSIVGSLEQYYVHITTYTDPRTGAIRTIYTYYYNDIIAFKVSAEGGFDWLTKINKTQVSTNDDGYFSSYLRFVDDGKLCFVFNDNVSNYDEAGKFLSSDRLFPSSFSKRKNVVATVEVNLVDGAIDRKTLYDSKELSTILVPKKCKIDYKNREILFYSFQGRRKERFGLISF